jgi:hypothetical protein
MPNIERLILAIALALSLMILSVGGAVKIASLKPDLNFNLLPKTEKK